MPNAQHVNIPVGDLVLDDAAGQPVPLGSLAGVRLLVLMRHRH